MARVSPAQSSLPPSMVQMGWEYPVPPPPSNALMGLMGDGPFAAGAGQPAGFPLPGCADCLSWLGRGHRQDACVCALCLALAIRCAMHDLGGAWRFARLEASYLQLILSNGACWRHLT